ncbi:MAG TPA: protein kinase [Thermoanaerobaculia bacterium]|nr:protein kinase [Thermoanaerobaculia bacterium]
MSLSPAADASFGPYKVESLLGAGGMGEVYLARDTRLGRKVAIKVLPSEVIAQPGRRERFLNEARAVSTLSHPNIVTMFDFGETERGGYLVMELVEGESLRAALSRGPIAPKRALEIAAQLAAAVAAAHAAGIVHRDLKPENVMITPSGDVKILDYGLAKLIDLSTEPFSSAIATAESHKLTATGTIVGTTPYMSPEQIEARPVDHRTDIFSLGIVLFEMLSGRRPFDGSSSVDIAHKILNVEPQRLTAVDPAVPPAVDEILAKALAKNPADRYQHAGDLAIDLRRAREVRVAHGTALPQRRTARAVWIALALLAILAAAFAGYRIADSPPAATAPRPSLAGITFAPLTTDPGYEGEPTFAPDGQTIAYVSDRSGNLDIYLKQISGGPDINLTNHASDDLQPSISPDGKQIAFVSTRSSAKGVTFANPNMPLRGGDLWLMPLLGGTARKIADDAYYPSWTADSSSIVFVRGAWSNERIYRVPAAGGDAQPIPLEMPPHLFVLYPAPSPDGKWLLFNTQQPDNVYVAPLNGGKPVRLAAGRHGAWDADSRSVVYSDPEPGMYGALQRVRLSDRGTADGPPQAITAGPGASVHPSLSRNGRFLAFAAQEITFNIERVRFDPVAGRTQGSPQPITKGQASNPFLTVSPDGGAVAFQSFRGGAAQIWRAEVATGLATQLTGDPAQSDRLPRWSPDGSRIAFVRSAGINENRGGGVWVMSADGAGPRPVAQGTAFIAWMHDGRALSFFDSKKRQIIIHDLETGAESALTDDEAVRSFHVVSPDGKWIAYQVIGKLGASDIKVRNVDGSPPLKIVATDREDGHPFFGPDGRWLYYQNDHKNVYRVPGPAQGWRPAEPQRVTHFPESNLYLEDPQLSPDGKWLFYSRRQASSDLWLATIPAER